jgi:anti-sigma factor RsiW
MTELGMSDMMTCGEARRLLWPDTGPRRVDEQVHRAQAHVSRCPACRQFLDDMRAIAERIGRAAPRVEAPLEVRDRLFKAVARARTMQHGQTPRPAWRGWAVAGVAVAAGLALAVGLASRRSGMTAGVHDIAVFAQDHRRAVKGDGIVSADSLVLARWLAARLPIAVQVPQFPGATLKGARLSDLGDVRAAVVEYDLGGRTLSYYVVPGNDVPNGQAEVRAPGTMPALHYAERDGYRVAAWQDAGLTYALVADLPEATLADLAHYCIRQMMARLPTPASPAIPPA